MEELKVLKKNVHTAYNKADQTGKALLLNLFGNDNISQKITDRIQSVEDAFAYEGKTINDFANANDTKDEVAYKVLKFVIKVLNEEWIPDYTDSDQPKYEPRFKKNPSGFGLAYDGYDYWATHTYVGPRLSYRSYDIMIHGVKILEKYYNDFHN